MTQTNTHSMSLSYLLACKKKADERLQEHLKSKATYRAPIEQYDEQGLQLYRTVVVIERSKARTILSLLEEQKLANKALLESGSDYFDASALMFREAVVINNVRTVNISKTTSASVRTVSGEKLASLIQKQINRYEIRHGSKTAVLLNNRRANIYPQQAY